MVQKGKTAGILVVQRGKSAVYKGYSWGAKGETAVCVGNYCGAKEKNCCMWRKWVSRWQRGNGPGNPCGAKGDMLCFSKFS